MLDDGNASNRERTAAGRALISAAKCNLDLCRTSLLMRGLSDDDRFSGAREVAATLAEIMSQVHAEDAADEASPEPPPPA